MGKWPDYWLQKRILDISLQIREIMASKLKFATVLTILLYRPIRTGQLIADNKGKLTP